MTCAIASPSSTPTRRNAAVNAYACVIVNAVATAGATAIVIASAVVPATAYVHVHAAPPEGR